MHKSHKATLTRLVSLNSVLLISTLYCLEKNTQAQLTVTIHSGTHNTKKATLPQLFSLHSVRLISALNPFQKNTQAQLKVTIHSEITNMQRVTIHTHQLFSLHSVFIRLKLFREEHSSTANSYHSLGVPRSSVYTACA